MAGLMSAEEVFEKTQVAAVAAQVAGPAVVCLVMGAAVAAGLRRMATSAA